MFKWPFASQPMPSPDAPNWERDMFNRLAVEYLKDRRKRYRWGLFFKFALAGYIALSLGLFYLHTAERNASVEEAHTALVKIEGVIGPELDASAERVMAALEKAFEAERSKAVVVRINSPGGSPVQSSYIHNEILRLKEQYPDKPVYAVATDMCASGGYYIAAAADEIYVDPASIVGSIGVRLDSFGFNDAMQKLGIQRRLLTAGQYKGILDPFSPESPFEKDFLSGVLESIHQQFIAAVKAGRGERLNGDEALLFSGLFWDGQESVALGLADGTGSSAWVARELVGAEKLVSYTQKRDLFDRFAERVGVSMSRWLSATLQLGPPTHVAF